MKTLAIKQFQVQSIILMRSHNPIQVTLKTITANHKINPTHEPEGGNLRCQRNSECKLQIIFDTAVPDLDADDDLVTTHLLCCDDEVLTVNPEDTPCAWRFEVEVPRNISIMKLFLQSSPDEVLLASTDKKQRAEVHLSMLSSEEKKAFPRSQTNRSQNLASNRNSVTHIETQSITRTNLADVVGYLVWKEKDQTDAEKNASTAAQKESQRTPNS